MYVRYVPIITSWKCFIMLTCAKSGKPDVIKTWRHPYGIFLYCYVQIRRIKVIWETLVSRTELSWAFINSFLTWSGEEIEMLIAKSCRKIILGLNTYLYIVTVNSPKKS